MKILIHIIEHLEYKTYVRIVLFFNSLSFFLIIWIIMIVWDNAFNNALSTCNFFIRLCSQVKIRHAVIIFLNKLIVSWQFLRMSCIFTSSTVSCTTSWILYWIFFEFPIWSFKLLLLIKITYFFIFICIFKFHIIVIWIIYLTVAFSYINYVSFIVFNKNRIICILNTVKLLVIIFIFIRAICKLWSFPQLSEIISHINFALSVVRISPVSKVPLQTINSSKNELKSHKGCYEESKTI